MASSAGVSEGPAPVAGIRLAAGTAGLRKRGGEDLVLVEVAAGGAAAGVFTRNRFCAAPVVVARRHLARSAPRFLLINAGNANAGTGAAGEQDAVACCRHLAQLAGVRTEAVLPFSTGVIGERLATAKVEAAIPVLLGALDGGAWERAARAIMTTDTRPKWASAQATGAPGYRVTGIAKGAGMIRPDMATMLAFVATDAPVAQPALRSALAELADRSFNCITVDGDTSTNDACLLIATGAAGGPVLDRQSAAWPGLLKALEAVFVELAQAIVRDGEGATKFVTIEIEQGRDREECRELAYTIAHSPLVKTALFASDPNWGRILAAVGRAPLPDLDIGRVSIWLDEVRIVDRGEPDPEYLESRGQAVLARPEITIRVGLERGQAAARVWTTDLSQEYVRINAEYRT